MRLDQHSNGNTHYGATPEARVVIDVGWRIVWLMDRIGLTRPRTSPEPASAWRAGGREERRNNGDMLGLFQARGYSFPDPLLSREYCCALHPTRQARRAQVTSFNT